MALSTENRESLESNPPPPASELRPELRRYLASSGMSITSFAAEVDYSKVAVAHFLRGIYAKVAATDSNIRRAIADYIRLHPVGPDELGLARKLLHTPDTKLCFARIHEAHERGLRIVIEGPPGTSKTECFGQYFARRNRAACQGAVRDTVLVECFPCITGVAVLREIARQLGANWNANRDMLMRNAVRKLRGVHAATEGKGHALILVDECQFLLDREAEALDTLRRCVDLSRCALVLAGHFSFMRHATNGLGSQLEPALQRFDKVTHLRGLRPEDVPGVAAEFLAQSGTGGPAGTGDRPGRPYETLSAESLKLITQAVTVTDRNAAARARLVRDAESGPRTKIEPTYASIRRLRKLLERVEEMRAIEENKGEPLEALVRSAARMMISAEGRAL
jgi:DNA transposition AAA+ family ATPase